MIELTPTKIKKFGWVRPLPRARKFCTELASNLPNDVDLTPACPAVYDQLALGSCTANAIAGLAEFLMLKRKMLAFVPSRLFIYYNERVIEGTVSSDSGASLTDGMTVVSQLGCPNESLWWYNINKFAVKPNEKVYAAGLKVLVQNPVSVDNTNLGSMQTLLSQGRPIVGGFTVYSSFESDVVTQTGVVPMPGPNDTILGGHAILVVGYHNSTQRFIVRNSWGSNWGMNGYFTIPYVYFTNSNLADDFWVAQSV
jgi:C1A family cysteine protease